jgi:serine/threonine-protein phosphatase 2A regulatory subunit B
MFLYTMSNGQVNICDYRDRSDFSTSASISLNTAAQNQYSYVYSNWLNYVSTAAFLPDQNYVISRDYLSVKVWDLRMGRTLHSATTTESMERNLSKLHTSNALDDEFFMSVSSDGKHVATGGYDRTGNVLDVGATWNCGLPCIASQRKGMRTG